MKKTLAIIAALLLILVGTTLFTIHNSVQPLWGEDTLIVETTKPLSIKNTKIEYGFNSLNRKNDLPLFKDKERYQVLFDGEIKDTIRTKYGENDFLVTYNNEYYIAFRQFKTWRKSNHKYSFTLERSDSVPILKVNIEGENAMNFEIPMIPISQAENFVCNTSIKDAGVVYNFLKLADPEIPEEKTKKIENHEQELIKKLGKLFQ